MRDQNVIRSILALVKPCQEDNVLEIGPGTGVLTEGLIQSGAVINAVEIDRNLAEILNERFLLFPTLSILCVIIIFFTS